MKESNSWKQLGQGQDLFAFEQRINVTRKNRTWEVSAESVTFTMFYCSQFLYSSCL